MGFHNLPNFETSGTVHLVKNNQFGFSNDPCQVCPTTYPSEIAKSIDAPIFHVNGHNAKAVKFLCQIVADWRVPEERCSSGYCWSLLPLA
ncbi:uncharacterized protein MELLADRAFT_93678 [Melampsora larici-populina 98AG31]|uniref:Dehydrogenase E1 component domain-containing protein n=1 Tax=Melampsora larici-populina (strain 98AG31 / pathotype 3-4-7) TaxID=747676 RepID=F4RA28_MELLP|nr:uncharacterized protein MELLADRAFT_93678 [Melampsora larici-populina 98AG31]EGG10639.1 hypothetical protein MELLADRAFT_93678 [Melampsora larici-populina 98AG31]